MTSPDPVPAFESLLADTRRRVDAELARLLAATDARHAARAGIPAEPTASMLAAFGDLTLRGGKRLRATLVRIGFEGAGGEPREAGISIGAGFELLQSYFLAQDDWMDGDDTRRGAPSVHVSLAAGRSKDLGAALAILASDVGWGLAIRAVIECGLPPGRAVEATRAMLAMHEDVVVGQAIDVSQSAVDVEAMHALKTASYTVEGPLEIGARAGGASDAAVAALHRFGRPVGIGFQLRDDLLGTFGDEATTGKPVGNDLKVGKRTAVLESARKIVPAKTMAEWDAAVIGKPEATQADVARVIEGLESLGVRRAVEARLDELLDRGLSAVPEIPFAPGPLEALRGFVELLRRTRT